MSELNIGAIYLSNKIIIEKDLPCWMYREEPEREGDSGWRVFSGNEDEAYLDNPNNFKLVSSDYLVQIDDSIKVNLLAPFGFSFERNLKSKEWEIVDGE